MLKKETIQTHSATETMSAGQKFAEQYIRDYTDPRPVVFLKGNLGAGKTTFIKGMAEGLGFSSKKVKSPTFTLVRKHKGEILTLSHCDFYRIDELDEFLSHTFLEMKEEKNNIIVVEWPEKLEKLIPENWIEINIVPENENTRTIHITQYDN